MPISKKELSEMINQVLETDVDWTKLTKSDLDKIIEIFGKPAELAAKLTKANLKVKLSEGADAIKDVVVERADGLLERFTGRKKIFPRLWGEDVKDSTVSGQNG